mmetsp:Transcript_35119/g.99032  ORF Transcript_35119/g.99032 Transcript_35119/m.99032 type:complete len:224 (+) Transcript_35119:117-788(+)
MASKEDLPLPLTPALYKYVKDMSLKEEDSLRKLREATKAHPRVNMLADPCQVQFMRMLLRLLGARRVVEVGVFTGYTTLAMALTVPAGGKVVALDVSEDFTSVGLPYWEEAGVRERIDLRIAPAAESLRALLKEGENQMDFIFIDANKGQYKEYYELSLQLLRPGGVIAIDNVLWSGKVLDSMDVSSDDTVAIQKLNEYIAQDVRVHVSLLTIGDGLTLCHKK